MKVIYDRIWGECIFDDKCKKIINTFEFQRMRNMKQLGSSYFIFSSASGNRFEHSIGVGYLANKFANILKSKYPYIIKQKHIDYITIAGLIHDIGHGPFSHLFDKMFDENYKHEERSKLILDKMNYKYNLGLSHNDLKIISYMIDPPPDKKNFWLYQIISGGIDIDRMDYIIRDSINIGCKVTIDREWVLNILESTKINKNMGLEYQPLDNMIESRSILFKNVYHNPNVIKLDKMINNLFKFAKLDELSQDIDEFIKLDDSILFKLYHDTMYSKLVDDILNFS